MIPMDATALSEFRTIDTEVGPLRTARLEKDAGYWERREGAELAGHYSHCHFCGRKTGKRDLWVFDLDGWTLVHPEDVGTAMKLIDYIGWHRIGPVCAKFAKGFTFTEAQVRKARG